MHLIKKINHGKFIVYFFLNLFILFYAHVFSLNQVSFINLRYLEKEVKTSINYKWEVDEIVISKNGKKIRIFLNIPYIIWDEHQKKIDTPPFLENGVIYISQYTFEQLVQIFETEIKKQSETIKQGPTKQQQGVKKKEKVKERNNTDIKQKESFVEVKTSILKKETAPKVAPTATVKLRTQTKILVFDPGHGGKDPGAVGPNGVQEKDIVLDITLRTIKYLKKENFRIYLTRKNDTFISLKRRAVFANEKKADLFISIHCNASKNKGAHGVRTYIYNRIASSREAAEAAKFENKNVGTFKLLLNDLRKSAFEYLSIEAAGSIQHCLVKSLRLKWSPTERAPFYVLANTNMPSALVEVAFISNPYEEKKLNDSNFREKIAKGIAEGVLEYFSKLK